jgi:MATE family multidrug resistance protein
MPFDPVQKNPAQTRPDGAGLASFSREALSLLRLAYPLIVGQLAVMGMAFTDAVVAGRLSTADLAGITLAGSIWSPLIILMITLVVALNPFLAQHYGAGRLQEVGLEARQGLWVALGAGVFVSTLALALRGALYRLDTDPGSIEVARGFLLWIAWGGPALGVSVALRAICETAGFTHITMWVHGAALVLNAVLDVVFVFGKLGSPAMGGAGCGLASAIVYWFILLFVLTHLRMSRRYDGVRLFERPLRPSRRRISKLLRLGLPMSLGTTAQIGFFSWLVMRIARDGSVAVAAHQVAMNFSNLVFMLPLGLSMGLTIRVAQRLGAEDGAGARRIARSGIVLGGLTGTATAALTLLFAPAIAAMYTRDGTVIDLAVALLAIAAAFQVVDALQVVANAVLRACKDTFKPMLMVLAAYWGLGVAAVSVLGAGQISPELSGVRGYWWGAVLALAAAAGLLLARVTRVLKRRSAAGPR